MPKQHPKATPKTSSQLSKDIRVRYLVADDQGRWGCPYDACDADFGTAEDRLRHMHSAHGEETRERLATIARELSVAGVWSDQAACRGFEMVIEPTSGNRRNALGGVRKYSRTERAALTLCSTCPVRRPCAEASLRPAPSAALRDPLAGVNQARGIWAGVSHVERAQIVRALGTTGPEAVEMILTVGERLASEYPGDVAHLYRIGERFGAGVRPRPSPVKRFHLRGPGPGRGHLGPVGRYVAAHGVSRSTAWRRLRAS